MNNEERDNIKEAKKFSLTFKAQALQALILERYRSLTIISSISFAFVGVLIAFSLEKQFIQNTFLAYLSFGLLVLIALLSLGRHLYIIRDDIKNISKQIEELPREDWNKPLETKKPKQDYWPEVFYIFLTISIMLFILSLTEFADKFVFQIDYREIFSIIALIFQLLGTGILAWPLLQIKRDVDDDLITGMEKRDEDKYFYTRKGFLKDKKLGLWGLGLLGLGFLIQLLLIIL